MYRCSRVTSQKGGPRHSLESPRGPAPPKCHNYFCDLLSLSHHMSWPRVCDPNQTTTPCFHIMSTSLQACHTVYWLNTLNWELNNCTFTAPEGGHGDPVRDLCLLCLDVQQAARVIRSLSALLESPKRSHLLSTC